MKLVWLSVNCSYSHSSLALPMLHSAAEAAGVDAVWEAVQVTPKDSLERVVKQVVDRRPDVLAGTLYLFNRSFMLAAVRRINALCPSCRVLLGGPEFLGPNTAFLEAEPAVDAVLRGEGEQTLPALLKRLERRSEWCQVPGLCWRDLDGTIREDDTVAQVDDLNALPSPLSSPLFDWSKPFVQIETSRGCHGRCTFCTSSIGGKCLSAPSRDTRHPLNVDAQAGTPTAAPVKRLHTVDLARTRAELEQVRDHGIREVRILDRTFNASLTRSVALLQLFRLEFPTLRFHLEIHPGLLKDPVRQELLAAPKGLLHIEAGLQTTSVRSLQACRRSTNIADALDGLRFLCACPNLEIHVDLLAGLPELDLAQILADVQLLSEIGPEEIQLETLKLLPGTPLLAQTEQFGIIHAPDTPYEVLRTSHMSPDDLETARQLSMLLDAFYNQPELHNVTRSAAALPSFYESFRQYLNGQGAFDAPMSLKRRFEIFHEYLVPRNLSSAEALEREWLRLGFSPQHGLCQAELWKTELPEDLLLADGDAECLHGRNARIWHLRQSNTETWMVFDRSLHPRQAVAVFSRADAWKS
jgi:radical SAM superfamily enzyme YgiQ (UPF0313 family)